MAIRPVFVVSDKQQLFIKENVEFQFFSGFSEQQKKKSINSLHQAYLNNNKAAKILEISSKSELELGVKLSAFNLMITTKSDKTFSVESAFQSSKVFEHGGPYKDLLFVSSRQAKKDDRLKNSGKLIAFQIDGKTFSTEPKTFFYNWLYINTLHLHNDLSEKVLCYDAFTDIEFNPQKSINCQAEAAAIYVSLHRQGLLKDALKGKDEFLEIVYPTYKQTTNNVNQQMNIFDLLQYNK
jgi:type I restriction enzyme M protein